jgi:hypothetical protein
VGGERGREQTTIVYGGEIPFAVLTWIRAVMALSRL